MKASEIAVVVLVVVQACAEVLKLIEKWRKRP